MLKTILIAVTSLFLAGNGSNKPGVRPQQKGPDTQTGTQEKLIVANGSVALDLDLNRLNGGKSRSQLSTLHFTVAPDRFFTILVFNGELRGAELGSMGLVPQDSAQLPAPLSASFNQLVIERTDWTDPYELVVRDGQTGFTFFNIEGNIYDYDAKAQLLSIKEGRLLVSKEFAAKLGRPSQAGAVVGEISITATMRAIEITQVVNGEVVSAVMPPDQRPAAGSVPGPDVIVGDLSGLAQFGSSSGTQVGLAVATDSCNAGVVPLNWLALPNNDHPVIPQNLYRMSGGATNDDRFEQVGQSNVKHAFTALQNNICGFGCVATASTTLGSGCSDPYSASLNSGSSGNSLGSRAWINPFTGAYPRGDSTTPPNTHTSHVHTSPSHRILVEVNDLNTSLNAGATYYTEAQYVTPHEYAWCVANPGQCNMYNNASFRQYSVTGTASPFSFTAVGTTVRSKPAIAAWTGATSVQIQPDAANDGIGQVAYKVTNPSPGVWHYEYAVYNQNLDRAIQSFSVPLGNGITVSNIGFHAPPQHPGWTFDGTVGNTGYSSTPWTPVQTANDLTWSSQTFAQNPNANAIRWGTLYNFRFDSNQPPTTTNATVGFLKTGAPITVQIQAPTALPAISINDVAIAEGNSGTSLATFTVSLSASSASTVTVQYATANGSATAGSDYVTTSGTVTFNPSETSKTVSVTINGDTLEEFNETFFVNLTTPVNATISDSQGVGTINNDDGPLATLPANFAETQINGLSSPTAFAIHPDGRIFVCEQAGTLRVIKNGALLPTPFTTISVNSSGERGLLGIAFDPNYATNRFVYVYYTTSGAPIHNRVSRFTADIANEDVAVAGSELAILDLDNLGATNHNGGAIHFGPDGKLYVAVGENAVSSNAQSLSNRLGKMLRINSDGTIPPDNPTTFPNIAGSPAGNNLAIWAVGLRNPYTFSFQSGTGRLQINDVGQNTWEEIDNGVAGSNYGWPTCEGSFLIGSQTQPCVTAGMTNPIYQYSSATASECAITGGDFYNPTTATFPAEYIGKYFFADFCGNWIKTIDPLSPPATGTAPAFLTGTSSPVDIHVANDGSLYYLARGTGSVFRVQYFGASTLAINDVKITEGNSGTSTANFTVLLSPASTQTVTVQYATANNSATAGSDYVTTSGTVTFTPGQTSQPVSVTINGDTSFEPDETFFVNLTSPTNATIGDSQGVGTITNDDSPAISGHVGYCITPATNVPGVSLNVTGSQTTSTATDPSGNYSISLPVGGSYTLTPTKSALPTGSSGINTVDVLSAQSHFLGRTTLSGCALTAADANGDASVNTLDVIAIQRFALGMNTGTANVGQWRFSPASQTYANLSADQTGQNYSALVIGDVNGNLTPTRPDSDQSNPAAAAQVAPSSVSVLTPSAVATVSLPVDTLNISVTNFTRPVNTSAINPIDNLIGFQGDFTFDSSVLTFQGTPASAAGLTATNWNVSANVIGAGTIKTLRISAFSNDFTPLSGSGTLFNLNFTRVSNTSGANTALTWANSPNNFQFIDGMLNTSAPGSTPAGSITFVTPTAANGMISGRISNPDGTPVSGAAVNLAGAQNRKTITDANGNYTFAEVETNGLYTVTPARANYTFSPASRSFSLLGAHTEAVFTATANGDRRNTIDTTEFFVRQHYLDFLGREPEEGGFNGWVDTIRNCAVVDTSCDRVHVSEMFYRSQEFQERGYFIYRFYATAWGRKPDYAEFGPDLDRVSGFLTNDQLEAAKTAFANDFLTRPAFGPYATMSNLQYVDALAAAAGVTLGNRQALIDSLNAGTLSRAQALRQIAESGEVYQKYYNQAFVVMEYFGYLRRDPDAFYLNWVAELDRTGSARHMVDGFVNSAEYRNRFVP